MLSSVFLGLSIKWLRTLHVFSWEIWEILAYVVVSAVITILILGPRNGSWIGNSLLLKLTYGILYALGLAIVEPLHGGDRGAWLIRGASLAAVAICSWVSVVWADQYGSSS